nr:MAG TPA: hypothetical protein [Caudoviricetes sp.]
MYRCIRAYMYVYLVIYIKCLKCLYIHISLEI